MMKKTKKCEECGNYFSAKRQDAKFCSNKCRQNNYRERHNIEKPAFLKDNEKEKEGLQGVKNDREPTKSKVYSKEYIKLNGELRRHKNKQKLVEQEKMALMRKYTALINKNPQFEKALLTVGAALGGAAVSTKFFKKEDTETDKVVKLGLGALTFAAGGYLLNQTLKETDQEIFKRLNAIRQRIAQLDVKINTEYFLILELEEKLKQVPKYVIEQPKEKRVYIPVFGLGKEKQLIYSPTRKPKKSASIINSFELQGKTFEKLKFTGKWRSFIGHPQPNFYMTIFGKAGQGKSNFSFQLAEYLANNHGKVLYVAREEGISSTTQEKINLNRAISQYLDFTDMREMKNISQSIEERKYRFVVLDSINTLNLEPSDLQVLKKNHPHLGIICIQQATKNGEARGSNEFTHDADVVIEVKDGLARPLKNRFAKIGEIPYSIF